MKPKEMQVTPELQGWPLATACQKPGPSMEQLYELYSVSNPMDPEVHSFPSLQMGTQPTRHF